MPDTNPKTTRSIRGFSLIEVLIVMAIIGILTAIALPQMLVQRRLTRSTAVTREILTQMRYARQLAMSQFGATPTGTLRRVAYTFQYDDLTKEIKIWGPIPSGTPGVSDATYPQNGGLTLPLVRDPLTQGGLAASEISYGIPTLTPAIPTTALDDSVVPTTSLATTNNKLNITFQPDGSVIDGTGLPLSQAMVFFNNKAAQGTASAISVIGASGRVKVWRYSVSANKYVE